MTIGTGVVALESQPLGWLRSAPAPARRALLAASVGWMFDGFDITRLISAPQLVNDPPDTPDALDALESQTATSPPTAPDPFNLDFLRFDPSLTEGIGVRKVLNTVPVRNPTRRISSASTRTRHIACPSP